MGSRYGVTAGSFVEKAGVPEVMPGLTFTRGRRLGVWIDLSQVCQSGCVFVLKPAAVFWDCKEGVHARSLACLERAQSPLCLRWGVVTMYYMHVRVHLSPCGACCEGGEVIRAAHIGA